MGMKIYKSFFISLSLIFLSIYGNKALACSMYKVTANGKTMVGCNEDAWRITSKIWFINPENPNEYGAGFTGSRQVGSNRTAPQSGMNEMGLTFSRLVASYPNQGPLLNRMTISNEIDYLTDILHKCATIEEVKKYIEKYDHSLFIDDVFIYIDSTGKYLLVEPYKLMEGNDPYYVLSNFCPSITDKDKARNLERYRKGEDFLNSHKLNSSLSFCSALSDSMHVCRNRNGDGTLLTSIWDSKEKLVNLYFYHSYDSTIQFNLKEELLKGDHIINIPDLFSKNLEFERLQNYITPFNTPELRVLLVVIAGLFTLFSILLGIYVFRNKNTGVSVKAGILISSFNLLLTAYLFVLATHINIYYFDAPYEHSSSSLISLASYIPFLLLLLIIPFTLFTIKRCLSLKPKIWIKAVLVANNLIFVMLVLSFGYWGLCSIWN